jgi:ribosome maturation factor RimP
MAAALAAFEKSREAEAVQLSAQERIRQVLLDLQGSAEVPGPIGELGLIIEDVAVTPAGKRRLVRIWLDRDLSGLEPGDESSVVAPLSLDEVAEATRAIGAALDASDAPGEAPYVLEVGSAGVDRPLKTSRHFRRNVSRLVEIWLAEGEAEAAGDPIVGRLVAAGPEHVTVVVAATKKAPEAERRIPYAEIARAQVQVEFARASTQERT